MPASLLDHSSLFQSTLPVWGATDIHWSGRRRTYISIHAPRVGSDFTHLFQPGGLKNISIHAPRVGSDGIPVSFDAKESISIHAPRVGSDPSRHFLPVYSAISIHAPRVGSDRGQCIRPPRGRNFNPRSPCGERRQRCILHLKRWWYFNPRSPCGERRIAAAYSQMSV